MNLESFIQLAFGNIASHIANLETLRVLIQELGTETESIEQFIQAILSKMETAEVTLRTDIRILVNEVRRLVMKKESNG